MAGDSKSDVLYEDKFVKVTKTHLIIKWYYFPTATNAHVEWAKIQVIYYDQNPWMFRVRNWGMTFSPVWWACDIGRDCRRNIGEPTCNVTVDAGTWPHKGFTVVDITAFLAAIKTVIGEKTEVKEGFPY